MANIRNLQKLSSDELATVYFATKFQKVLDMTMKELLDNGSQTQDNYEIWKTIRPSVTKVTHE